MTSVGWERFQDVAEAAYHEHSRKRVGIEVSVAARV